MGVELFPTPKAPKNRSLAIRLIAKVYQLGMFLFGRSARALKTRDMESSLYGALLERSKVATAIHRSPGHVIDRLLYVRLVAEWLCIAASILHQLVHELYPSTEFSAFVCSPTPRHDNLVTIYPCDASQKCKEFTWVVM